ncbi:hypothetical protein [Polaribacter sp. 20A6]|nr:hypothetical protein [Polaribacter sp. 20A6]
MHLYIRAYIIPVLRITLWKFSFQIPPELSAQVLFLQKESYKEQV